MWAENMRCMSDNCVTTCEASDWLLPVLHRSHWSVPVKTADKSWVSLTPLNFLSFEEITSFSRCILLNEVANRQAFILTISKPFSTNVETVSSRVGIAPIALLLLLLFGMVSSVVEHPESGLFDQVPAGRLSQVIMKWDYKAWNIQL